MTKLEKQIKQYMDYCEFTRNMTFATLRNKRTTFRDLSAFLSSIDVDDMGDVTNEHINQWIATFRMKGSQPRTVNGKLKHLHVFVKWLRDMGEPVPKLKLALVVKDREIEPDRVYYSRDEIDKALHYADRREWLLIEFCFSCGLRAGEVRRLQLENIRGDQVTFIGKGRKRGFVYMCPELQQRLEDWIEREKVKKYIFKGRNKDNEEAPLSYSAFRNAMRKPFMKAGYFDFHPHALRHSCATEVVSNGARMEDAQQILRHSSVRTTQVYVHSFDGGCREIFQRCRWIKDDNLR